MTTDLVSIIVPFYNEERYISTCLDSLCHQTYPACEIIAVDDASTDTSLAIAQTFPSIRILRQSHAGPGAARNTAARQAKGSILIFADADMYYDKNYVSNLVKPIIEKKAIGTTHVDERVANPENIWSRCWSINAGLDGINRTPTEVKKLKELNIFRAIRKDAFLRAGGFDIKKGYFDDVSLAASLKKGAQVVMRAQAYHYNPESLFEVFQSSRWIGKSSAYSPNLTNFLRYSIFNSLRNALRKISKGAPLGYILFKIVYDTGMFVGIFFRTDSTNTK